MDLENIMLSKISQSEKAKNHDFTHMRDLKQTHRHIGQYGGYQREGGE